MRRTPATARAGVIFGGTGSASGCFWSGSLVEFDAVVRGPLPAKVVEGAVLVPVAALSVDDKLEETGSTVGFTDPVLKADGG